MRIYSELILEFNKKAKKDLVLILKNETSIEVNRSRFFLHGYYYPIIIESFIDESDKQVKTLGEFDFNTLSIRLNYSILKNLDKNEYLNILRHEFAHYLAYLHHGSNIDPHGSEFKDICMKNGWREEVYSASIESKKIDQSQEKKKRKYEKLIKLSKSSNIHEASLALSKANEYMLELDDVETEDNIFYLDNLVFFKRKNSKLDTIYHIMKEMNFGVVFRYAQKEHSLETFGTKNLIEQSHEIYHFLDKSLDQIYKKNKESHKLKGLKAKNSFFRGFCLGVLENLKLKRKDYTAYQKKALIKLELLVNEAQDMIYGKLSRTHGNVETNKKVESLGFQSGKDFNTQYKKHTFLN